jgi:hypothetical protein
MYDQEKDKKIKEIGSIFNGSIEDATIRISVEIYQYGKGDPKVSIQRWYRRGVEDWKAAKLGRLTPKEAVELQKLLSEAVEFIDTQI